MAVLSRWATGINEYDVCTLETECFEWNEPVQYKEDADIQSIPTFENFAQMEEYIAILIIYVDSLSGQPQ